MSEPPVAIDVVGLAGRDRYRLLTTLVVPRPIGWASTYDAEGTPNLAPFSYFAALSATPALVGLSVGARSEAPKDTLVNIRATGAFCINVVSEPWIESMNRTSAEVAPDVDEFRLAGLTAAPSGRVHAPYVAGCPAVLECELRREVELPGSTNTLVVAEVVGALVDPDLMPESGYAVDPRLLRPVGRLGGSGYMLPGSFLDLPRP